MGTRPGGAAAAVARARSAFLGAEPFDPAAVRAPILASWSRSRARAVPVDGLAVPYRADFDPETPLALAHPHAVMSAVAVEPSRSPTCRRSSSRSPAARWRRSRRSSAMR